MKMRDSRGEERASQDGPEWRRVFQIQKRREKSSQGQSREYKTHDGLRISKNVSVARAVCGPWAEAGKTEWDTRVKSFKH